MNNQDWYEKGEEIGRLVSDAVNSGDYAALSKDIAGIVGYSLDALQENLLRQREMQRRSKVSPEERSNWKREGDDFVDVTQSHSRVTRTTSVGGSAKGLLAMVLGYSGTVVFGILFIITMLLWSVGGFALSFIPTILFGALTAGSYLTARRGKKLRQQTKLEKQSFDRYGDDGRTIDGTYTEVHEEKPVKKSKTSIKETRSEQQARERMEKYSPETRKILEEGDAFIRQIHQANEKIDDDDMSEKLARLEHVVTRIFTQVAEAPDSAPDLRRMMSYYIPTTTKLINAYCELDAQKIEGTNIESTKREIANSLDTINQAFEIFLDGFFQDTAWDIETDIRAMKSMMAHDGLVKGAFDKRSTSAASQTKAAGQESVLQKTAAAAESSDQKDSGENGKDAEAARQMMQQH